MQASMMLNQFSRAPKKKKQNKLFRFIKRFVAYLRTKNRNVMPITPLQLPQRINCTFEQAVR
jgi:hypothetical protein